MYFWISVTARKRHHLTFNQAQDAAETVDFHFIENENHSRL